MKKSILFLAITFCVLTNSFGQKGFLRGKIMDNEIGETLIGVNVFVAGTTTGTVSDFNGDYSLPLAEGHYKITFSSISYASVTVTDVLIKPNIVTKLDVNMETDVKQLEGVLIKADALRDSEAAILATQKNSFNMLDGISSQSFDKIGDSDLSNAMKRVTGVSVEGGKYVYVRGLGDRYTKTTLNGMSIPGLDPDKNSVQIDIFPTAVLENVMVYKTFSPNLYGDFTGGAMDIETKDFPDNAVTSLTLGLSFIPGVQFNDNFILYNGGKTDWLGLDDGTRAIPFDKMTEIPPESQVNAKLEQLTRSFNPEMAAQNKTAFPNGSFSFNTGSQVNRENVTLGYNVVLNYNNTYSFYDNIESNNYLKDPNVSVNELFKDETRIGAMGKQTVMWSGLFSGALKFDNHSFSISVLRSQSGESTAVKRVNNNFNQTDAVLLEDVLTYTQRSVTNAIITGKHNFNNFQIEWKNAISWARVYDPDFRLTSISVSSGDTTLNLGDGAGISRFYRDLNEQNESFKLDFIVPYTAKSKFRFGGIGTYKKRDFEVLNYFFRLRGIGKISANPDWFLQPENIWTPDSRKGTYVIGNFEPTNNFNATQLNFGAYAMTELYVIPQFKAVFGLRAEKSNMYYTGQNNSGSVTYDNEKTLGEFDILPSINLVYSLGKNTNLRGSFNQTLARPSFKEKSIAQIFDPISKRTFSGNIDLKQTSVNNMDVRWEYFMKPGELISISTFYKTFHNHIELVSFPTSPDNVKPRNARNSWVYGAEFEVRKEMGSITPFLHGLSIGVNVSLIKSFVDMNTVYVDDARTKTEKQSRELIKRQDEIISSTRPMAGQAPYLLNANINYSLDENGLNFNLAYNVQGETLSVVGSSSVPDVYTIPFHSLSFNTFKTFGVNRRSKVAVGINNILNNKREQVYKGYKAKDQVYATYNPGTKFSLKYSYLF